MKIVKITACVECVWSLQDDGSSHGYCTYRHSNDISTYGRHVGDPHDDHPDWCPLPDVSWVLK